MVLVESLEMKSTQVSDWPTTKWGELASLEYGKALRNYKSSTGPYRVFGTNGPIGWHDEMLFSHSSVIIGRKGAYRGVHYSARPFFVIDTAFYLKPKANLDTRWAYYQLLGQNINDLDSGSAIPSTRREDFYNLPVKVPPLPEQRAIAHVLGTLDDKIELNRRMNETLEAMARALFKSWFVDFLPVRAKMAAKQNNPSLLLPQAESGSWFVYAIECSGGTLYIGQTENLRKRWLQHSSGKGGRWTKSHPPQRVAYWEKQPSRQAAVEREKWLKTGFGRKWLQKEIAARTQTGDPVHAKSALKRHKSITPPLRGSRQGKGASPQASRWGAPSRPQSHQLEEIKRLYSPLTLKRAKAIRQSRSDAEGLLWHYLRKKQLNGHKFRRQQPIGRYIVDFVCMAEKLVIELDGGQHSTQRAYDEQRDQFLTDQGYRVFRFWNSAVFEDCYGVLESILATLRHEPVKGPECPPPKPNEPVSTPPQGGSDWTVERAKAYLERMDPEVADLFPDRLVDSELGEIPEGWEVGYLADIAVASRRGVDPTGLPYETPYIGLEHMPRHSIALAEWGDTRKVTSSKSNFEKGNVLFGKLRPYFHKVGIAPVNGICSTDIVVIVPKGTEWSSFLLACVSSNEFVSYTNQTSTGTKMPRTSWKIMGDYRMCLPTAPVVLAFQAIMHPVLELIVANIHESRVLSTLRDVLLPKLVSGKLRMDIGERG